MPGLFFIAAALLYGAVLRFTPFGRYVYAIGGNEEAARLSGINVGRVKIVTYAISGMLAGIAAVLFVAQYRQGKPDAGAGLELDAIAAVVIGGTSLMGGRGGSPEPSVACSSSVSCRTSCSFTTSTRTFSLC
jgi:simple sugar transport system permease protein